MNESTQHQVTFSGKAGEYFGIWIVNILLSALTLGIYSAWAKVRNNQYIYQHLQIDGRQFDYHATGKQILIGRIIVVVALIVLSLLAAIPVVNFLIIIAAFFIVPWLIVRSVRFNARVTSWSGLRFNFEGRPMGAFLSYLLYPVLSAFTLYLTMPFAVRSQKRFMVNNFRFGSHAFKFDSTISSFYGAAILAFLFTAVVGVVLLLLVGASLEFSSLTDPNRITTERQIYFSLSIYALLFLAVFPAAFIYQALIRNVVYNNTKLEGGHGLISTVHPMTLVWIGVSNAVASILSLGLLLPWARIRMISYLAANTQVTIRGSIDDFHGQVDAARSAIGDAYGDIEGLDIGLPV